MDKNPANLLVGNGGGSLSSGITKSTNFNIVVKSAFTPISFSTATDAQILEIAQKLQTGEITVEQTGWNVGDTRNVQLSAFQTYSSSMSSTSTQSAQTTQLVILHKQINGNCAGKQFADNSIPSFIIGFSKTVTTSYWGSDYQNSCLWNVETNIYNALPSTLKSAFKQFKVIVAKNDTTNSSFNRYFTSAAEKEIFGSRTYSSTVEANALTQFDYYKIATNRKKRSYVSGYGMWWERSSYTSYEGSGYPKCYVGTDGTASNQDGYMYTSEISPFGCI